MRRRVSASLLLAACASTLTIGTPQDAAIQLISTQSIGQPIVDDVPHQYPMYAGPTSESLHVTIARVVEAKRQQELAWYAEATRQINERAAHAAAHPNVRRVTSTPTATASPASPTAPVGAASAPTETPQAAYDANSIEAIIVDVFGVHAAKAIAIATCESGLNPAARNRSGASGLFQIMMPMHADLFANPADVFDPRKNAEAAFSLSSGGTNWSAWVCRA